MQLKKRLGPSFEQTVEMILASPGKVITTGIGKSGIVARKITATLSSTGTTSIFLHPVEALHGDLGMVSPGDVVLALSHSGRSEELVNVVPQLREHGAKVVAMTGGLDSPLAQVADLVIDCGVEREACPLGLAPTTSTTAAPGHGRRPWPWCSFKSTASRPRTSAAIIPAAAWASVWPSRFARL